ncbi:MAG: ribonuclease P protein component [Spirochaetes bacterium]|nr:ribonuclease P protein component [Spirochaetota bacterium]
MKRYQSLKGKKVFWEVLKKGRRFYEKEIQIIVYHVADVENFYYKSNDHTPLNLVKVGIQIHRKYGNSVKRNLAKRRIRAICRELLQGVNNNFYIIIRPLEKFKKFNYEDSKNIIRLSFNKAGVISSV